MGCCLSRPLPVPICWRRRFQPLPCRMHFCRSRRHCCVYPLLIFAFKQKARLLDISRGLFLRFWGYHLFAGREQRFGRRRSSAQLAAWVHVPVAGRPFPRAGHVLAEPAVVFIPSGRRSREDCETHSGAHFPPLPWGSPFYVSSAHLVPDLRLWMYLCPALAGRDSRLPGP